MNTKEKITVYLPNSNKTAFLASLITIFKDIKPAHELAIRLFKRDLKSQYRQSFLGFFWVLVPPILTAGLWVFLNNNRIVNVGETDIPYPLFVIIGTILWQIFAEGVNQPLVSVRADQGMLTKINFPREALLLSGFYSIMFNLGPKILVLATAIYFFQIVPDTQSALFSAGAINDQSYRFYYWTIIDTRRSVDKRCFSWHWNFITFCHVLNSRNLSGSSKRTNCQIHAV